MSERAKLFEALMRHLWCYWLKMPPTTKNFYEAEREHEMSEHIDHAMALCRLLKARWPV